MGVVIDQSKKDGRDTKCETDNHRFPCALGSHEENSERGKEQRSQDAAKDDRTATVVVHGGLRISVK